MRSLLQSNLSQRMELRSSILRLIQVRELSAQFIGFITQSSTMLHSKQLDFRHGFFKLQHRLVTSLVQPRQPVQRSLIKCPMNAPNSTPEHSLKTFSLWSRGWPIFALLPSRQELQVAGLLRKSKFTSIQWLSLRFTAWWWVNQWFSPLPYLLTSTTDISHITSYYSSHGDWVVTRLL